MEEIVACIATKLAECLWDPISRHARYLICLNKFVGDVEKAKGELEVKLADVNKRKEEANRKTEEIMPSVKKWLEEVNVVLEEVQKQQQELDGGGNKCFKVPRRYSLAKQMEVKANKMKELKSNSSFEPFSQQIQLLGINAQFSSKEVMDFQSRKSTYNSLLEAIKDGKNKMVGLYGMGGSGKTTLAIEVGKEVEQLKLFDKVVMVVVSRPLNVEKIQKEIIGQTGLKFEEKTELTTAQRLLIGLSRMKILIILDDVWSSNLNLQAEIGIPLDGNCCILLTTRLRDVCDSMRCDTTCELSLLTTEEAWALLMMHANLTSDSFIEFADVGRKIIDECKGLPIAVVTVGRALRGKGIVVWEATLRRLQRSQPLDIDERSRGPFACLELSYDYLPSLAQQLFLLCSMFPEDHEIHTEDLIRFAKGTLKFEEIVYTMEDARSEILLSINKLLDSCLLMHTDKQACVKMHDLVRDVALWITKKKHQAILVDSHAVSRTLIGNETLKETKAISLWNLEKNFKLSNQWGCPTLEILLLHSDEGFIEDLGGIEAIKVLALVTFSFGWIADYERWIQWSMPQSIVSSLMNTHTLCLRGIALGDISSLCQLKMLEILDLHGSQFDELPGGIADMKNLKLLDVFMCQIEESPLEVIQRCEQLEELYFWDNKSVIPKNFSLSRLERYFIYDSTCEFFLRNDYEDDLSGYLGSCEEALRALSIQGFKVSDLNSSMKDLIFRANFLWLENCMWDHKDINVKIKLLVALNCPEKKFIVENFGTDVLRTEQVFPHLITLKLTEMNSIEQVFQDSSVICSLPMLQELYIEKCPKLTTIFTHATVTSLPKLREVYIHRCDKVKWLFSYSLAARCPSLEELKIKYCYEFERLIQEEVAQGECLLHQRESHHDSPNYPYGNEIESAFLVVTAKSFKQLQNHEALTLFLRLKHVNIEDSGRRKKGIFNVQVRGTVEGKDSVKAQEELLKLNSELCSLCLNDLSELEYIWKAPTQSLSLHQLESVRLWYCPKLRNIFTFAIVTSFPKLREVVVDTCEEWEGILCEESVKYLSSSSNVCFSKLQNIQIMHCNKVKRLFSYPLTSHGPPPDKLLIQNCSEFERLVDEEASHEDILLLLLKLKYLHLEKLPKLGEIFGGRFENKLESLHNKQECSTDKHKNERVNVVQLELISIALQNLPKWEYIWKGPTQSVSLHRLRSVTLLRCPKLKNIFTFAVVTSLPELRKLDVYGCEEWEGILCEESIKYLSSPSNVCFPKLQNIYIRECNKVKRLFSYSLASHCPSLEQLNIKSCFELESLDDEEASHEDILLLLLKLKTLTLEKLPKLREIFGGRSEHKLESLYNKLEYSPHKHKNERVKVVNLELISIQLEDLPKWEYIWKGPTQSVSLHRLESVTLWSCPKLRNIFTFAIVTSLSELRMLEVCECKEWKGIFCEESLKNLSSSTVCFPKLGIIRIFDCPKVRRLFSYSLASHCPSLEEITIQNCSQLEGVVQAYEDEVAGHHEKLFPKLNDLDLKKLPKLREIYPAYEFNHLSGTIHIEDCPNICNIPLQDKTSSDLKIK